MREAISALELAPAAAREVSIEGNLTEARELEAGGHVREGAEVLAAALMRQKERDDAQLARRSTGPEYGLNYEEDPLRRATALRVPGRRFEA